VQPTITLLVGNIGSGKSTVCKKLRKTNVIISRDAIRYMIGGGKYRFDFKLEPMVHDSTEAVVRVFMLGKKNIVLDETNMSKSLRAKWIRLAQRYNYRVHVLLLPKLTMEESVNRRMNNPHDTPDRKLWEHVWKMFDTMFETPTKSEGIHKIIKFKV